MTNRINHLLACISEEAGEVIQEVGKIHRFGLHDIDPRDIGGGSNYTKLLTEFNQLVAVMEMLTDEVGGVIAAPTFDRIQSHKKHKVEAWLEYSESLGDKVGKV